MEINYFSMKSIDIMGATKNKVVEMLAGDVPAGSDVWCSAEFDKEAFTEAVRKFPFLSGTNDSTCKNRTINANAWSHQATIC